VGWHVPPKRRTDDIESLRIKLRRVDDFVSTFEYYVEQLRGRVVVEAICQTEGGGPELLLLIKDSLAEMAKAGFVKSFIDRDIADAREALGSDHQQEIESQWETILAQAARVLSDRHLDEEAHVVDVLHFASDVLRFLENGLRPAKVFRDSLANELGRQSKQENPATMTRAKLLDARDDRIRELVRQNPDASNAQLAELCREDSQIKDTRQKVSKDIVRDAKRGKRGKRRSQ
jgi:hypothetical protein